MPWHPALVHYPIAGIVIALCFQAIAVLKTDSSFHYSALISLGISALASFMAALSGTAQEAVLRGIPAIHDALELHETLGNLSAWLISVLFLAALYLQLKGKLNRWVFLIALAGLAMLVLATGHYGGRLVYIFGAGVTGGIQP